MGSDWTGIAFQENRVSGEAVVVFGLAVLLVYLVLAFLYESWLLPFAVILVVPLGLLGVVAAVNYRGTDNNVYTQIGIVLIGQAGDDPTPAWRGPAAKVRRPPGRLTRRTRVTRKKRETNPFYWDVAGESVRGLGPRRRAGRGGCKTRRGGTRRWRQY